jgi:ketosteroid isomerase-like protein
MPLFDRTEIERAWAHDQKVARRCGPACDWAELCDLYSEDATMIVSGGVEVAGREAMKRW